jgi:hypothetical protein
MERLPRNTPLLLLGAAMVFAAAVTLAFAWHTTFYADTWELLINRRDPTVDNLLRPHNEHLVVIPILINELFLRVFGMTSGAPELILLVGFLTATAGLLYVYVERRMGAWPALFAAVLLLFLGPAYEVLLWPFEITFVGPMMFGLAALLALEREDTRGDALACLCLVLGLGFSNLGVPFVVGGFAAVMLGPRPRWLARAYVWAVPLVLFAAWYLGWGHDAESHMSIHNLLAAPAFVVNSVAVAVGSLTGLGTGPGLVVETAWGRIFLVGLVVAVGIWLARRPRPRIDRGLWAIAAVAAVNWILAALNAFAGREPTTSRYQYAGVIFVLAILACLLTDLRPARNWLIGAAALVVLAVGPNIVSLHEGAKGYKHEAVLTRSDTAAIEIAGKTVDPNFELSPEIAGTGALINVFAGDYLEAVDEYGSPAYSVAELNAAPEEGRKQADIVLARALGLVAEEESGTYAASAAKSCVTAGPGAAEEVPIGPGATQIEAAPGPEPALALRRFAVGEFPVTLPAPPSGGRELLRIPADAAKQPWYLHVSAAQPVRVCG